MKAGKVEYAPDYKSEKRTDRYESRHAFGGTSIDLSDGPKWSVTTVEPSAERARLEKEVVEALKECRTQPGSSWEWLQPSGAYGPEICGAWEKLNVSLDALLEFESKQERG